MWLCIRGGVAVTGGNDKTAHDRVRRVFGRRELVIASRNTPLVKLPTRRHLRAFAFDPMSTRLSGRYLDVDVRFEELLPGPVGELL